MNESIYRITLDVLRADSQVQLTARAGDSGRQIIAALTERGVPYPVSEGCSAFFITRLPDGQLLKNPCAIQDGVIVYTFTPTTTALAGMLECELRLLGMGGEVLVTPRFSIAVYDTIYTEGDAVLQDGASIGTVKAASPGFAQVFLWSDGNPELETRLGRLVSADTARNAGMVTLADGTAPVLGVATQMPGFSAAAGSDKFGSGGILGAAYAYVTMLGFAPVVDNGSCTVNGRCTAGADGTAVPCEAGGFLVAARLDENTVTVLVLPDGDAQQRLGELAQSTALALAGKLSTADGAVGTAALAASAVTAEKLAASAVTADKLADSAVTAQKLAPSAVTGDALAASAVTADKLAQSVSFKRVYTAALTTAWEGSAAPYTQSVGVTGLTESSILVVDVAPSTTYSTAKSQVEAFGEIYRMVPGENTLTAYAHSVPGVEIPIQILEVK